MNPKVLYMKEALLISLFRINPKVAAHLPNSRDLCGQVVTVTNEYYITYLKRKKNPNSINVKKFDASLIAVVNRLLDEKIKKPIRKYLKVQIERGDNGEDAILEIMWDESIAGLMIPKRARNATIH